MRASFNLWVGQLMLAGALGLATSGCSSECPDGQCGEVCVDLLRDPANCGVCGEACDWGFACVKGVCVLACQDGLQNCDGACVDLLSDRADCGECGHACGSGEICWEGVCSLSCQSGLFQCDGHCVDRGTDRSNCGKCGFVCAPGEICSSGVCTVSCQQGLTQCNRDCIDLDSDRLHCGACGNRCAADAVCAQRVCYGTTPVTLQLLGVSDFHGQLDPAYVPGRGDVGGAAVLASYFAADRAANPNTLTLAAGDCFGASPPLSSLFDEEPTVRAMDLMGFDAAIFGDHAFDHGLPALQAALGLSQFTWISTNLTGLSENLAGVVAPYALFEVGGLKVAIVGLESPATPDLVPPGSFGTLQLVDPVASAQAARELAQAEGARVFVAVVHLGATSYNATWDRWNGPLLSLAHDLSGFQVVIGGHTHRDVSAVVDGTLVTQTAARGLTYARVQLTVVPLTGAVVSTSAELVTPLSAAVTPDPAVEAMLEPYRSRLVAQLDRPIGAAAAAFGQGDDLERLGEAGLGNLVADALRAKYGTQIALVDSAGLRAPLPSGYLPADLALRRTTPGYAAGPAYDLVLGDAHTVLPLGRAVVTRTITGSQLWRALEHGVSALPAADGRFLQVSGIRFTYRPGAPAGSRVTSVSLSNGTLVGNHMVGGYTVALPDHLDSGGDGFTMLAEENDDSFTREPMADVLAKYIESLGIITPFIEGRIVAVP